MKVSYPVAKRVSIWVGNFSTEDDFDKSIDTDVSKRLALPMHIAATCEVTFQEKAFPIRELIQRFSGSKTFIDQVEAKAAAMAISPANAALVCYYVVCEDAPKQWGSFRFLGTFVGQDVT